MLGLKSSRIFELMRLQILIVLIVAFFSAANSQGQDLIVTVSKDSIHCKIENTTETFIYYRTKKTKRNSTEVISRKEILELFYNYEENELKIKPALTYSRLEVFGTFTGSRIISESHRDLPSDFDEYLDNLRWGVGYSVGVNYFFSETFGVGALFSQNNHQNRVEVFQVGTFVSGDLSDDIRLQYLAGNIIIRGKIDNSESYLQLNVGLGYLSYYNEARTIFPYIVQGSSLGGHILGVANLSLGAGVFIPIQLGIKGFSVDDLDLTFPEDLPDEFREGITFDVENNQPAGFVRFELSVGLMVAF